MSQTVSLERPLSTHELSFVDMDGKNSSQIISGVCVLTQPIKLDILRDRLRRFIERHPHYRCRIVPGKSPQWSIDSHFHLSYHCEEIDAPSPLHSSVISFVAENAAKGFSSDHPPWKCTLITSSQDDSLGKSGASAVAFSAHHAFVDGLEGFKLLNHLFDQHPVRSSNQSSGETRSQNEVHSDDASFTWNCVKAVSRDLTNRPIQSPLTGAHSPERRALGLTWPRQEMKKARRRYSASFQELVLAVLSNGLRRYCERRGEVCDVRAILPLGRSSDSASGNTTNRHDPGLISLPLSATHTEQSIENICRQLEELRKQQKQQVFTTMLNFLERFPRGIRSSAAHRWTGTSSLLISLIPGPMRLPKIDGVAVESIYALPALAPSHAMAIGVVTLRETVCVAIHHDPTILDDPESLQSDFDQAYHDLIIQ